MNRKSLDAYYTPAWLAEEVVHQLPADTHGSVLDPTAGEGSLLAAAAIRFGTNVRPLAIDVDPVAARRLARRYPEWVVSNADFLDTRSRQASGAWRNAQQDLAAVLLNPPFSFRGNGGHVEEFGNFRGRVSPALHFLLHALRTLSPRHGFIAILPNGALDADRAQPLWQEIGLQYEVERVRSPSTLSFPGARVATSIVQIVRAESPRLPSSNPSPRQHSAPTADFDACRCLEVVRGRVPVHSVNNANCEPTAPFLHTTGLRGFDLASAQFAPVRLADDAPLVCIPRVGAYQPPLTLHIGKVVLSDCVIGVRPRDPSAVAALAQWLNANAHSLRALYRGTGAQYVTLAALAGFLSAAGWHPHIVAAGTESGSCCCHRSSTECGTAVG